MGRRRNPGRNVTGILLLDKPLGQSSNEALQRVKRFYRAAKAGHTGSLDPLATGLLPVCLGAATKFSAFLLDADKRYRVRVRLGVTTTTADAEGEILETRPSRAWTPARGCARCWTATWAPSTSSRPCTRRSSTRASVSTSWRARASRWSAPRDASISSPWICECRGRDGRCRRSRSTSTAPRAPMCAPWPRTSAGISAAAAMSASCAAPVSDPTWSRHSPSSPWTRFATWPSRKAHAAALDALLLPLEYGPRPLARGAPVRWTPPSISGRVRRSWCRRRPTEGLVRLYDPSKRLPGRGRDRRRRQGAAQAAGLGTARARFHYVNPFGRGTRSGKIPRPYPPGPIP